MFHRLICVYVFIAATECCCLQVLAADTEIAQLHDSAKQAAVEILVDGHHSGSGCFVDKRGIVATAAHVIGGPNRRVEVMGTATPRALARVVAVDIGHDVALLQVDERDGGYPFVAIADALPRPGDDVFLYSTSVFRRGLLQRGMVARDGLTFEHQGHFVEVLQIAALIQEGTSGGPWMNRRGELIGVQSGAITSKSVPAGLANVAPASAVRTLLATRKHAATPTIGIFVDELWVTQPSVLKRFAPQQEGVIVQLMEADGPAAQAGIKRGEVITAVDSKPFRFRDEFVKRIWEKKPGDKAKLTIVAPDGTGSREVEVPIGKLEVNWQ